LRDDEVLLAIVGISKAGGPRLGCALTTRRVYWPDSRWDLDGPGPPRCQSLSYPLLPDTFNKKAGGAVALGDGRWFGTAGPAVLRSALIDFLIAARMITRNEALPEAKLHRELGNARSVWPRVAHASDLARRLQREIREFEERTLRMNRPRVTSLLVMVCVLVFLAMAWSTGSFLSSTPAQLLAWGGDFGPSVILEHEYWRLLSSIFLHVGLLHILMNMVFLIQSGPFLERVFGHFGFAALYVLSGIGGSIAGVWEHPSSVGAGASGAIFGIIGGLLGFFAIRQRDVPLSVLKPMRAGAIGFVAYNTFFGMIIPGIDMAAHLGGLGTGFISGLLMTLAAPADVRESSRPVPTLLRAAVVLLVAMGLALFGYTGIDSAKAKIAAGAALGVARDLEAKPRTERATP
jgi:rhomboid protease GluP